MLNSTMWLVATLLGSVEIIEWFLLNTVSWPVYLSIYIKKKNKTVGRKWSIIFIVISFRIKRHRHFLFILLKTVQELLCLGSRKYSFHIQSLRRYIFFFPQKVKWTCEAWNTTFNLSILKLAQSSRFWWNTRRWEGKGHRRLWDKVSPTWKNS